MVKRAAMFESIMDEVSAPNGLTDINLPLGAAASRPDGLMVFDGTCRLCARSVRVVSHMDRVGAVQFVPAQSDYGRALCRSAGVDPDDPSTFLFFDRGQALGASEAVLAILRRMPRRWSWLRPIAIVPRPVRDRVYDLVARNRYRLCGREACLMLAPEVRSRCREDLPNDTR